VCTLMQFKKTDRRTHTQTHRAYKWLQVPPSNLTVNVGNDKWLSIQGKGFKG